MLLSWFKFIKIPLIVSNSKNKKFKCHTLIIFTWKVFIINNIYFYTYVFIHTNQKPQKTTTTHGDNRVHARSYLRRFDPQHRQYATKKATWLVFVREQHVIGMFSVSIPIVTKANHSTVAGRQTALPYVLVHCLLVPWTL